MESGSPSTGSDRRHLPVGNKGGPSTFDGEAHQMMRTRILGSVKSPESIDIIFYIFEGEAIHFAQFIFRFVIDLESSLCPCGWQAQKAKDQKGIFS